jgi:hypothetical protein
MARLWHPVGSEGVRLQLDQATTGESAHRIEQRLPLHRRIVGAEDLSRDVVIQPDLIGITLQSAQNRALQRPQTTSHDRTLSDESMDLRGRNRAQMAGWRKIMIMPSMCPPWVPS